MSLGGTILFVGNDAALSDPWPGVLAELGMHSEQCRLAEVLTDRSILNGKDAVVLEATELAGTSDNAMADILEQLDRQSLISLVWGDVNGARHSWGSLLNVRQDESAEMLKGRLATLLALRPILGQVNGQRAMMDRITQPMQSYMSEVDEEMRLAARLQRDFLPRTLPEIEGFEFASIYRPATWVSGDIYDLTRLDEHHIGFYVADAVGHGMPAALLTMFIKRSVVTKRISGRSYELVDPADVLLKLNADLVEQQLSNFQFVTCCYGILNTQTLRLQIANGGHPAPMLIDAGASEELEVGGPLLGVFPEPHFVTESYQLERGQKLLLFSDGVEVAFVNEGPDKPLRFRREFGDASHYDIQTMCNKLMDVINAEEGSLHPRDDVTLLGIQINS